MKTFTHKNILIIKKDGKYFLTGGVIPENYNQARLEDLTEEDLKNISQFNSGYEEAEVIFSITPSGIKIEEFFDLYQFNCCSANYDLIEALLYVYALETGSKLVNLASIVANPDEYSTQRINEIEINYDVPNGAYSYDQTFSFRFKGHKISGTNQMIKYSFFSPEDKSLSIWDLITSVEDLVDYYITVNKILAIACYTAKDDMFLSCDQWAKDNVEKFVA